MTKKYFVNILLLIISFILIIVVLEIFLSHYYRSGEEIDYVDLVMLNIRNVQKSKYKDIVYELSPNVRDYPYYGDIINSHGFRSPSVTLTKPNNTLRILVLGDSITFGVQEMTKAYSYKLEQLF